MNDNSLAPRLQRFFAYIIDSIPIVLIVFIIFYFLGFDKIITNRYQNPSDYDARMEFIIWRNGIKIISFIIYCIYCIFLEASSFQGTFGKYILKIQVVKDNGEKLTLHDSARRNLFKIISYLAFYLGFVWSLRNKKRQTWHDIFAKTIVVDKLG